MVSLGALLLCRHIIALLVNTLNRWATILCSYGPVVQGDHYGAPQFQSTGLARGFPAVFLAFWNLVAPFIFDCLWITTR